MVLKLTKFIFRVSMSFKENMNYCSFVQQLNIINNKMELKVLPEDYDFSQEIATSCYGDMLHDEERNMKFGEALKVAIEKLHSSGKKAHVLDIGTGTGLLSMLAVKYGADSVTACEAFLPMANCASSIIKENNCSGKINIVKSHSTQLTVGENGDLKQKANILISEVFDTELIGEGAIKTFNHAHENLLTEDCIVIPSSGIVYAQVVESEIAQKWNKLNDCIVNDDVLIKIPKKIKTCPGTGAVHDIQLSEFNQSNFKILSDPIPIFRFNWAKNQKISVYRQTKSEVKAISSGKAQVIFVWWDLIMDEEGDIVISCAPVWEHKNSKGRNLNTKTLAKNLPWRDHWMQAVYFFENDINIFEKETFSLISYHDEFSYWFNINYSNQPITEMKQPVCNCSFHFILSRNRIGAINDNLRQNSYSAALKSTLTKNTVCIVLGDTSLLPFLSAKFGAKKVFIVNDNPSVAKVCNMIACENGFSEIVTVVSSVLQIKQILVQKFVGEFFDVLIMSEPYFRYSILPWDNITFWYLKDTIVKEIKEIEQVNSLKTLPMKCKLKGCVVQFDNLWKIATPLNTCEGFSMKIFDNLIKTAKEKAQNYVEPQPLWEYPAIALSHSLTFLDFDFTTELPTEKTKKVGKIVVECSGKCDGMALWMEYDVNNDVSLSFGPTQEILIGEYLSWNMFEKQGVHLFRNRTAVTVGDFLNYDVGFDPRTGEINFLFSLQSGN